MVVVIANVVVVLVVLVVLVATCCKVVFEVHARCLARVSLQKRRSLIFDLLEDELAEIPIPKAEPWAYKLPENLGFK